MYVLVYLSLFWAGFVSAYIAAGKREAQLTMTFFSILCWLGITFTSRSIEVLDNGSTTTFASTGLTVIGATMVLIMFIYAFVVVTGRFPTNVDEYREEQDAQEGI